MSLILQQCDDLPLGKTEAEMLWNTTRDHQDHPDDTITVRCVSADEIATLNQQYRDKNQPTNVLTFNYPAAEHTPAEHDIVMCLDVVKNEADERNLPLRDYTALVLVHGLLHATGLDHEQSNEEAKKTRQAEQEILQTCGFAEIAL